MYSDKQSSGKHLICDFKGVSNVHVNPICRELCQIHNYTILGEIDHLFHPQGYTALFLLSESHLSVHTFPEKEYISFDLYTCRDYPDNSTYLSIFEWLKQKLNAKDTSTYQIIDRFF
jgi:S-adenosylmethionine decarboxylase